MDARPKASEIKKYLMWSKINELWIKVKLCTARA